MKVYGRDRNVKVKMLAVCEVIVLYNQPKNIFHEKTSYVTKLTTAVFPLAR